MESNELEKFATRCRVIGGADFMFAASLASLAAKAFPADMLPVIEHAFCTDIWNHMSRAIARGEFDQAHAIEAAAIYAEVSSRALALRAALGLLGSTAQAPEPSQSFTAAAFLPLPMAAVMDAAAAPLQDALTAEALMDSPSASFWLRECIASALERDLVDAANDAELLARVLAARADAHNATQATCYGKRSGSI